MNRSIIAAALAIAAAGAAFTAPGAAIAAKPGYSTTNTELGKLMDDPASKAVLMKYIPQMISDPQINMARSMTLKQIQTYASDILTNSTLARIDFDLAKLPPK